MMSSITPPQRHQPTGRFIVIGLSAALAAAMLLPGLTLAAGRKSANVSTSATVLVPVSVSTATNLSSGAVKTQGNNPDGVVMVPASYPAQANPQPNFPTTTPVNGANAAPPNAAQVNITGSPGQVFTLRFQGWTQLSGEPGSTASAAANTYYVPGGSPTNAPGGVLNAQGRATVYIGSTITVARNNPGTTVVLRPTFTVTYN
jgi:hypothetical protein